MHQTIRQFTTISSQVPPLLEVINTKIKDLVSRGLYNHALTLYKDQVHGTCSPFHSSTNNITIPFILPSIFKACGQSQTHKSFGLQLHCNALKYGYDSDTTVSNSVITMYAKFSDPIPAFKAFETMPERDTISWNSIINCSIQNGWFLESLDLFKEMYLNGFVPKPELIACVISSCARTENFRLGRAIHALCILDENTVEAESIFVSTALVDFYWKCHDSAMAFRVFGKMEDRNEVSWTAMITGCVNHQMYDVAFDCFRAAQVENIKPNRVTLISFLPACAALGLIKLGKEIHGYGLRRGFDCNSHFSSALIEMYCECGDELRPAMIILDNAVEKDVVMWTAVITSCARYKDSAEDAIRLVNDMQRVGVKPNSITLLGVISACTTLLSRRQGSGVHGFVLKSGFDSEICIGNSLISMYAKLGDLNDSVQIFNEMSEERDSVSWTAVISAHGFHGHGEEALRLFNEMQQNGIKPDGITYLALLSACSHAGLVEEGQKIFNEALRDDSISPSIEHYACYIDLLGRAGKLYEACDIACRLPMLPSTRIWSSLVTSCKLHGRLDIAESLGDKLIRLEPENAANHRMLSMINAESDNWLGVEEVWRGMARRNLTKCYGVSKIELHNMSM